jgi:hypothetical protein
MLFSMFEKPLMLARKTNIGCEHARLFPAGNVLMKVGE